MSNAMTVDVNTTIRRVCWQSWANTLGINLILVHPFGFSCGFRLSWAPTTHSPEAYMSSATSVPLKSCDLTPMVDAGASTLLQVTGRSLRPTRRITVPSAEAHRFVDIRDFLLLKTRVMSHPSQLILLALPAVGNPTSFAFQSLAAGIIQPVQRLAVKVYTCSWLINSAWY